MKRLTWGAWIVSIGLCAAPLAALHGQTPATGGSPPSETRTVRPRSALETAIDYHLKGDYETAEAIFAEAEKYQQYFTAEEKAKMTEYRKRNQEARVARSAALKQIEQVSKLLDQGKTAEAETMLKGLRTSKHLNAQERQQVAMLDQQIKQKGSSKRKGVMDWMAKDAKDSGEKPDTDAMVTEARRSLERGEIDQAEKLAKQAEAMGHRSLFPWSDTPAKVMKDVQASRAKMTVKVADANTKPATKPGASASTKMTDMVKPSDAANNTAPAKELLRQASQAAKAGDTAKARKLVAEAEALKPNIPWYETLSVESVKKEIAKAEAAAPGAKLATAAATGTSGRPSPLTTSGSPTPTVTNAANASAVKPGVEAPAPAKMQPAEVKALVKQARQAYEKNDYDRAETLAKQARVQTSVKYGLFEDTPDKVLADVLKSRDSGKDDRAATVLAEARRKMEAGQYDEAEKLTYQAEAMKPSYPLWHRGERHDKLRAEIVAKRKTVAKTPLPPLLDPVTARQQNVSRPSGFAAGGASMPASKPTGPAVVDAKKQDAVQLVAQARISLNRADYPTALRLAAEAKQTGATFAETEDSPEAILAAVRAVQASAKDRQDPVVADAKKRQAMQLVADARLLQKEGRIIEALQCAQQAKKLSAAYGPSEDNPDVLMSELRQHCGMQMNTYSQAAKTLTDRGQYPEAERYWRYVFNLAMSFGLETQAIGDQIAQVQRMSAGTASVVNNDSLGQGGELLLQAEKEMARGDLIKARDFANALYSGPYNAKDKARELLARIDDAEHKAIVKSTRLAYEQGVRAYQRKEYAVAQSYFQSVDLRLLDEEKRSHAMEILSTKEMQANADVKVAKAEDVPGPTNDPAAGKTSVSDNPPKPLEQDKPALVDQVRKQQILELQRLRQESITSQQQANKLAGAGDLEGAVETLQTVIAAVRSSGLDAETVAPLLRQLESRHKQYSIMREQVAFSSAAQDKMRGRLEGKQKEILHEESKKEQVSDLMKKYKTLFGEGKYADAYVMAAKAHELDPDAPATDAAMWRANMMRNLSDDDIIKGRAAAGFGEAQRDVKRASIADVSDLNPVSYDPEFKIRTAKRGADVYKHLRPITPMDREVTNKLNTTVSVDFKNKPLGEVLNELRSLSKVNIVPDLPFIEADNISLDQNITIQLDGVPLRTVLTRLLHNAKLTYAIRDGVVLVTTAAGQRGNNVRMLFPVADLVSAIDRFASAEAGELNSTSFKAMTGAGTPTPVQNTPQWTVVGGPGDPESKYLAERTGQSTPGSKAPRKPGQSMEDILIHLIKSTIEPANWDDMGGSGHIEYYPLGMSLVVSQTPDILEQVQQLLERLRELQDLQVTVEVRFITLTEDFYERIGIDFDVEINDNQTRFDSMVATNNFAPPGHLNEPDHLDNVIVGMTPVGNFTSDLDIPINSSSFALATPPFGGFPGVAGQNGGLDMGIAFLSSIEVFLFMEAAQGDTRTNIMSAPKITLFNGQTASINSTQSEFLVTQVDAITNPFTGFTTFIPRNQLITTGTFLSVQAVVTADRRYVQLTLSPSISNLRAVNEFSAVPGITVQQPAFDNLNIATTVSVPDGGTILMGGLKNMSEGRNEFGPPILSKIPYINRLFRNVGYGREARSLMIMVTPRIIIPEEEEERLGNTFAF